LSIKNKKFKIGDLVMINNKTHWIGDQFSRCGIVIGTGRYHESYMILSTEDGIERQFHASFMKLISSVYGEKITLNKST